MKILLLVLGGAWFFVALIFVFALAAARAKAIPPIDSAEVTKPVPETKPHRRKLRPPMRTSEREPVLIRNPA